MKRSVTLFSVAAGIFYLSLSSYQNGPASGGQGNRTTSGTNATCGGGCHGANNTNTSIAITLTEGATPVTNGKYKPNTLYTVTLSATNTLSPPAEYGFQLTAVKPSGTQAGALTASGNLHTSTAGTGGLTVVEQSSPITATSGAATIPAFSWLSPAAGTGTVAFHVIVNAVNGNNNADNGDHATTGSFQFAEQPLSVKELANDISIVTYPNPFNTRLNLSFENTAKGIHHISVFNINGKIVAKKDIYLSGGTERVSIETNEFPTGIYLVNIQNEKFSRMTSVTRN
jgi:hypothetical protein